MINYKYNFLFDLKNFYITIKKTSWFKKNNLVFYRPSIFKLIKIILNKPKEPNININKDINCYWVSSGTWGSYSPPNNIFICPWEIPDLRNTILHEIKHLELYTETKHMSYEEREKKVNENVNKFK